MLTPISTQSSLHVRPAGLYLYLQVPSPSLNSDAQLSVLAWRGLLFVVPTMPIGPPVGRGMLEMLSCPWIAGSATTYLLHGLSGGMF